MAQHPVRRTLAVALGVAAALGLVAPVASAQRAPTTAVQAVAYPTLTVHSKSFGLELPARLSAGFVRVTVVGPGQPWTGATLGLLKPGITQAAITAALRRDDYRHENRYITPYGGPAAGETTIVNLPAGRYVVFDTEQDAKGKNIYAARFFTVAPATMPARLAPMSTATWTMDDLRFRIPPTLPAGPQTLKIVNADAVNHMAIVFRLAKGTTYQQLVAWIKAGEKGQPPVASAGNIGTNELGGHQTTYLLTRFAPGSYAVLCFSYDATTGKTHEQEGMTAHFVVQ